MVVGYDYDNANGGDNIYCHFGYHNNSMLHITPESRGYTEYDAVFALTFNTPHSCSNNYVVQTYNDENEVVSSYYCYEHKDIITYDHVCDYTYSSTPLVSTDVNYHNYHTGHCHCTKTNLIQHNLTSEIVCTECNYQCEHSYNYTCLNDLRHRGVCRYCTHIKISPHVFRAGSRTCLECYAIIADGLIVYPNSAPIAYSINGSYVMGNGCIVLVPEDEASYFNGTLIFYKAGEVPEVI